LTIGEFGYRHEILLHIEGQILVQARIDREGGAEAHQQRVPVRRRLRDEGGSNVAAGSGTIVDQNPLPKALAEPIADDAGNAIRSTARREWQYEADRLCRIVLSAGKPRRQGSDQCRQQRQYRTSGDSHGSSQGLLLRARPW
jgi:hypothetical protein